MANQRNQTIDEAWASMADEALAARYATTSVFGWPPLSRSPLWAYWYARNVVANCWPPAEEFIATDQEVYKHYCTFLNQLKEWRAFGDDAYIGDLVQRAALTPKRVKKRKDVALLSTKELEVTADAIAEKLSIFKGKRKEILSDDISVYDLDD